MKKLATVLIVLGLMLPSFGQAQVTSGQAQVTSKLKGVVAGSHAESGLNGGRIKALISS